MAIDSSEEEQLQALKQWWDEHGTSVLITVAAVLALLFGAQRWQASQSSEAGAAGELYQQISDLLVANVTRTATEDDLLSAQGVYSQLRQQHGSSIYTRYAALAMAKLNVEQNNLDQAAEELQWLLDNPSLGLMQEVDEELLLIARQRLARVRLAQGQPQAALDLLRAVTPGKFVTTYADTEGDALLALGDRDAAIAAFQRALGGYDGGNTTLLRLKLQELGVSMLGTE